MSGLPERIEKAMQAAAEAQSKYAKARLKKGYLYDTAAAWVALRKAIADELESAHAAPPAAMESARQGLTALSSDGGSSPSSVPADALADCANSSGSASRGAPPAAPGGEERFAEFAAWLVEQMPAGTVISDPLWWAPRIYARAAHAAAPDATVWVDGIREKAAESYKKWPEWMKQWYADNNATTAPTFEPVHITQETDEALLDVAAQLRPDKVRDLFVAHYARCRVIGEAPHV